MSPFSATSLSAALLGALAGGLCCASPPRLARPEAPTAARVATSSVVARRGARSLLASLGAMLLLPGVPGALLGLVAAVAAWRWSARLVPPEEQRRRRRVAADLPVAVELLATAVRAGLDPASALGLVVTALPGPAAAELQGVLDRLALAGDVGAVWRWLSEDPVLGPLGRALARAHRSGASLVVTADRLAAELREAERLAVESRAKAVSTRAAAPLGLCFLPAFVLVGIVPLVAGLVGPLGLR